LLVKFVMVIALELGPKRLTGVVGRLTEKLMLGAPETDTVEGAPAPESSRLMLPVLDLKLVLCGAITTVAALVSGTKEPKPKAVAAVMLNALATVAVAETEKAGVVVCAQPIVLAPVTARATPMRARRHVARPLPRNC
jgi:hypothetical protein